MNWRLLQFLGAAILATAIAIIANEGTHKGMYESFSVVATVISLLLAVIAHFREK